MASALDRINPSATGDPATKYFYTPEQTADLTGVSQEAAVPKFRGGLQLGTSINAPTLDVATPGVLTPAVIVVTSIPTMFTADGKGGAPDNMGLALKELIESGAKSVSGIDFGYTLQTQGTPVGHDSQTMEVPTKASRQQPTPTFTFAELQDNFIYKFWERYLKMIQDPDTNASLTKGARTMSSYAFSFMALQFGPTRTPESLIDAAHYVNVFPKEIGMIGLKREIGEVAQPERQITCAGIVQHNPYIKQLGINLAKSLSLHKVNSNAAPPYRTAVDAALAEGNTGLGGEVVDREKWTSTAEAAGVQV